MIDLGHKNIIDVVKYRAVWLIISALLILPGIGAMIYSSMHYDNHAPLKVGIDFTGGTITQFATSQKIGTSKIGEIRSNLEAAGIENPQIQIIDTGSTDLATIGSEAKEATNTMISVRSKFISEDNAELYEKMTNAVKITASDATIEQSSSVGPTLGAELFKNSMWAMLWVFVAIIAYIAWRFRLDYAIVAIISLAHDVLFIVGIFSILGLVFGTEIDSLFITALLTVVGFSNHDTIVVFDRIRENIRFYSKKATLSEIINGSVNQTLARSINTSVTTLLTLTALYFFGGVTTRDFVFAMILGIFIGTYSSIFFASTVLAWYKEKFQKSRFQGL